MDFDQDDGFSTFITIASIMFGTFCFIVVCMCLFQCYRKRKRQALFSSEFSTFRKQFDCVTLFAFVAPVVVTAHPVQTSNGQSQYPVQLQTSNTQSSYQSQHADHQIMSMPMPMTNNSFQTPYQPSAAPYPTTNNSTAPYLVSSSAPYPLHNYDQQSLMHPPSYNQVTNNNLQSQKQPSYNPNFNGWRENQSLANLINLSKLNCFNDDLLSKTAYH